MKWPWRERNADLDHEIRAHLDAAIRERIERGESHADAERNARREFGSLALVKETTREQWGAHWLDDLLQDLRYGTRMLRKNTGFTAVAVFTLALGIGANTAIFSLLYGLAFRNLPVPHPEQLVRFGAQRAGESFTGLSLPMFEEIARNQKVLSDVFAWSGDGVFNVEIEGAQSRADVWPVTGNFQSALGGTPELGRLIEPGDADLHAPAATQVAVLGYDFWKHRYGGRDDVIGKILKIEGIPFAIVGVTRKGFQGFSNEAPPEITVPLTADPLINGHQDIQEQLQRRNSLWVEAAGRLRPGITLEQARVQLFSLWPAVRQAVIPANQSPAERSQFLALYLKAESGARGASYLRNRFTEPLYLLLGIAGLVLLVACFNLASLTLARNASRSHEISVRVALGATRRRLVRQMLTESALLSVAGMLAGLGVAYWSSQGLSNLIIREIYIVPAALNITPDLRILGFAIGAAVLTAILFGLAPAWRSSRELPGAALQKSSRVIDRGTGNLGRGLIVTQIALSLVLLAGASLFTRTLQQLRAVDPGFRTRGLLDVRLYAKPGGYKNIDFGAYYRELTDRVSALPHVSSAAIVHMQPGGINSWTQETRLKGENTPSIRVDFNMVMPGAFRTMGIALLQGRDFTWQDDGRAQRVAIVSRSFADQLLPGREAIGQSIEMPTHPKWPSIQIVGIAADATLYDLRKHAPPTVYVPPLQYGSDYSGWGEILVQTDIPAATITGTLRQVVESMGHEYVFRVEDVSRGIDRALLRERVTALLSLFFGGLALLLVAIGLYGLSAYEVTRRTREIGIRVALGAPRESVLWLILREVSLLSGFGITIGLACALAASRLITSLLYGVSLRDPLILISICGLLIAVATVSGLLPARRALRVDPVVALRYE